MSLSRPDEQPPRIRALLPESAHGDDQAVAVGSRAGIIEWADSSWTRVTGYDLGRFIDKPVGALIDAVKLDAAVVDFVARCIRDQRICEIDVPLTTPAGANGWIHLRVEPVLDEAREVSDFVAVARDITAEKRAEVHGTEVDAIDLSDLAQNTMRKFALRLHPMTSLDLWLGEDMPFVLADEALIAGPVERLIRRAAESMHGAWGTLTVTTGLLGDDSLPIHPDNLYRGLPHAQFAYIEVHDTGDAPNGGAHQIIDEPFLANFVGEEPLRLAKARRLLARQGGEIRIASSPWFGTSVVLLLPYSIGPDL
jgi:PAS domain S-box-containing protein